jgi:hypothetical protein
MSVFSSNVRDLTKIFTKNPSITLGLLTSRNTKNKLHKLSIVEPNVGIIQIYKIFKTTYFSVLRGAKKLYYTSKNYLKMQKNLKKPGKL